MLVQPKKTDFTGDEWAKVAAVTSLVAPIYISLLMLACPPCFIDPDFVVFKFVGPDGSGFTPLKRTRVDKDGVEFIYKLYYEFI